MLLRLSMTCSASSLVGQRIRADRCLRPLEDEEGRDELRRWDRMGSE